MNILITGSAGFIGFHLAKKILTCEPEAKIVGYDNCNDYYDTTLKAARLEILSKYPEFEFVKGDLADDAAVKGLFSEYKPEVVVHLAAQAGVRYSINNPKAYIDSNILGTFNILEACRKYPVKHLVYASSSSVYGANGKVPYSTEDRTDSPVSLYAATKKSCELVAYSYSKLYDIPATGLRFFTVYGPWGRPDMAYFKFTDMVVKGQAIQLYNNGDLMRDFTYIDDIVEGVRRILQKPPVADCSGVRHKVYNIGNQSPVALKEFVDTLEVSLKKSGIINGAILREYLPMQLGDVYQTFADVEELDKDFGFRPSTPLSVGLGNFAKWYKEWQIRGK